jgi:hypothetical protein
MGRRAVAATASPTAAPAARAEPLGPWVRGQVLNVTRHAKALRPFRVDEFGTHAAAPTEAHTAAVNELIARLRERLFGLTRAVQSAATAAASDPRTGPLQRMVAAKEVAHEAVRAVEKVWDFFFELFGQRQAQPYADWLLGCDRVAADCYQAAYLGVGERKSIPAPPPFSYMRTGFSPATFRRGIKLTALGKQVNPFPLVQLPYHRLVNPWTLGAVLHEVSHNLQSDLGLAKAVPRAMGRALLKLGVGPQVAGVWVQWNREIYADMSGLLLGGPAVVGSLFDIIGRSRGSVLSFNPAGVHPTPYLRAFLSIELLRRMGFAAEAEGYRRLWVRMYPDPRGGSIPARLLETAGDAVGCVVDAICYRPFPELGNRSLAQVQRFGPKEQGMVEEAAQRLGTGKDPGIVPERFLIGAVRFAVDNRLDTPGQLATYFYKELARR